MKLKELAKEYVTISTKLSVMLNKLEEREFEVASIPYHEIGGIISILSELKKISDKDTRELNRELIKTFYES